MDNDLDGFIPYVSGTGGKFGKNEYTSKPGCYIYTDKVSKKQYVGSSGNLAHRINSSMSNLKHGKHKNKNLQEAYNKNPDISIVVKSTRTVAEAQRLEQKVVDEFSSLGNLFNIGTDDVTQSKLGVLVPEETRSKLRELRLGVPHTEEYKQRMSITQKERIAANVSKTPYASGIEKVKEPVMCDGIVYSSLTEAAKALSIDRSTLRNRCKSDNFPGFFKVTNE